MVARITTGKSIRALLHYNENKVADKEAELIHASGFLTDTEGMTFTQKLKRFECLIMLRPNVKTNSVHISLNFHSSEKLDDRILQKIADTYMQKIGLGDQPFLVYRHDDAKHLHLHIVSTNINAQRKRMDLHDIGRKLSEPARKEIEEEFNLVKAESKLFKMEPAIRPADLEKAKKGKLPTKRTISNVLTAVLRDYKFTSLTEFNAVLKSFNVVAKPGEEGTPMQRNNGLLYSVLDGNGNPTGVPIKASSFYNRPTLKNLELKFEKSEEKRKAYRTDLKSRIDDVLTSYHSMTRLKFTQELKQRGIDVHFRENEKGMVFGVTYVDHQQKVVFNGSDLGKGYSAGAITTKLGNTNVLDKAASARKAQTVQTAQSISKDQYLPTVQPTGFLDIVLAQTKTESGPMIPKRRKKRRKQHIIQQQNL